MGAHDAHFLVGGVWSVMSFVDINRPVYHLKLIMIVRVRRVDASER